MNSKKFVNSWDLEDRFSIYSPEGFVPLKALHKTVEYDTYVLTTSTGKTLECADNHLVLKIIDDIIESWVYMKNLQVGDVIATNNGNEEIVTIMKSDFKQPMYDFEISDNHADCHCYYTNGILSHNTYIARTIAKLLDVPFTIVDSTVLTESGYVGEDVESILTRLLQVADYDVEKAEHGIVFIDEIDKIARKGDNPSITLDVSGEGVQQGLLKLLEGSVVLVPPQGGRKHPDQKMIPINTKDILFICGGAFDGIDKKIAARMNQNVVGYKSESHDEKNKFDTENPLKSLSPLDLKSFGMIPEIIGRLPVITYMDPLDEVALRKILTEPKNSLVKQYKKLLAMDGIELVIDDDVYDYIVEKTIKNKIGARGLRGMMEELMTSIMFNSPSEEDKTVHITLEYAKEKLG